MSVDDCLANVLPAAAEASIALARAGDPDGPRAMAAVLVGVWLDLRLLVFHADAENWQAPGEEELVD
ncbi:hypothetical protein EVJ50_03895 [Synechococcus sp. RSCCF101]|uniref:hypothetical protein n=1 Tax=Synechococcus sp. RSCCF101 TaxID=2511069 RepID=UPI001243C952|nr:hypothetical protein [Synechococcus sp. RSCCF101]QEY31519.1 hypothetical protein EVJ50_03895 [Synechococcus sp. RSCCF101]